MKLKCYFEEEDLGRKGRNINVTYLSGFPMGPQGYMASPRWITWVCGLIAINHILTQYRQLLQTRRNTVLPDTDVVVSMGVEVSSQG